jgi:hypothetical protein
MDSWKQFQNTRLITTGVFDGTSNAKDIYSPAENNVRLLLAHTGLGNKYFHTLHHIPATNSRNRDKTASLKKYTHASNICIRSLGP